MGALTGSPLRVTLPLLLVAGGVAGCGGSGSTAHTASPAATSTPATTTPASSPATTPAPTVAPATTFKFVVKGASPHATPSHASLNATVRLIAKSSQVCWRFTDVKGLEHPAGAHINRIAASNEELSYTVASLVVQLGKHYSTSGCSSIVPGYISQIDGGPNDFALVIGSAGYPDNALHALLGS
jgi:hypothetical protein